MEEADSRRRLLCRRKKKRVGRRREAESGYRVDEEGDCGRDRDEYAQGEREGRRRAKTEAAVGSGDEG